MDDVSFADPPFAVAPAPGGDVVIELPGIPEGKGRPRFVRRTGHAYTPEKTRSYEGALKHQAHMAMAGRDPLDGPISVKVEAHFPVPQSWSGKKRAAALAGDLLHTTRPDWENIAKMLDALNEVVWRDDRQVAIGLITKHYSTRPRLHIVVRAL